MCTCSCEQYTIVDFSMIRLASTFKTFTDQLYAIENLFMVINKEQLICTSFFEKRELICLDEIKTRIALLFYDPPESSLDTGLHGL